MLVAKREPFERGAQAGAAPASSRFARALSLLQMLGALIALPVGIGSAYSMYQANFSAEATCKSLRVNIVRMLDKNVDTGARHMLVRRDVEAFEKTCGTVDPDATAAFKSLLAAEKAPVTNAAAAPAEPQAQAALRKSEPPLKVKPQAARTVANAPVQRDATLSDTAWLAAVRSALAQRDGDMKSAIQPNAAAAAVPALAPRPLGVLPVSPAQPQMSAPALPPADTVAAPPAAQVDPDRPVPPAAIPQTAPAPAHSRLGGLVAHIPFVGQSLADRVSR